MLQDDYEFNYMPSNFSKRYKPEELLNHWIRISEERTRDARSSLEHQLDVPYGSSEKAKYDVYGTNLPKSAPIFVFIHGGYWVEGSKDLSGLFVSNLVSHGIKVIIPGYDLCPKVKLTEIVQEIKTLIEKILSMAHSTGSSGVWIGGHSAGAHLAASILHDKTWFEHFIRHSYFILLKGLVLISGIYDLNPLLNVSVNEALQLTSEEIYSYTFAPLHDNNKNFKDEKTIRDLKVLIAVGECDSPIFVEESRRYSKKLLNFMDRVEFLLIRESTDHFNIVENLANYDFLLSKILIHNIKNISY